MCSVKVITGHVGLLTCVHSWTRVQILTCPEITFTGHKPFPLVYYLKITFLHFKQHYTHNSTHFYLLIFITTISLPCELRQPNRNIFSFQKFPIKIVSKFSYYSLLTIVLRASINITILILYIREYL